MALIVKYKFQNVDANGNSVTLLPQFPSGVSYTKTDVVEGNITTRVIETDDLSKVTYIRFGCNESTYVVGAWEYLTEILDINISYVSTFYRMFRGCKLLNKINVSNWNTNKVTNMTSMFDGCVKLAQLDVSNFDTSNVTAMSWMFNGCSQLTQLDVSKWVTSKVANMQNMFYNCSQLTQLDVSKWVTNIVTNMNHMFYGCSKLTQLDVSNWDTSNVIDMSKMFYNCSSLTQLNLSKWVASSVTSMNEMFRYCSKLTTIGDVSNWDTKNVTNMDFMFQNCSKLTQLDASNWVTSSVTGMNNMFAKCSQLTQLDLSNFDTSKVTSMANMFTNCKVENVGLIYCSEDTINKLANCITSPCNFYVTNKTYTSPNPLVKYVMYREDEKRILYYNEETQTWEKPVLRQWDSIEKHSDGKYYYHKRSEEVILNGSENWRINPKEGNITQGLLTTPNINTLIISDKFNYSQHNDVDECIWVYDISIVLNIAKSKLSSQDVAGFKTWLQANPVTAVYQLAQEKVYECTDLDLITYSGETNLLVKSGVLNPKVTLKVHQNITNIITILQNKVSVLENVFIQGLKQVLAGDMQSLAYMLYPEDFENIEQSIDETSLGEQQDDPTDK